MSVNAKAKANNKAGNKFPEGTLDQVRACLAQVEEETGEKE